MPYQEVAEQSAVYALRIMALEAALRAIVAAWDQPYYGEVDALIDHLHNPIEEARKLC